jgi:hypothetical protein
MQTAILLMYLDSYYSSILILIITIFLSIIGIMAAIGEYLYLDNQINNHDKHSDMHMNSYAKWYAHYYRKSVSPHVNKD